MDFGGEFLEFSEVAGLGLVRNAVRNHPAHWAWTGVWPHWIFRSVRLRRVEIPQAAGHRVTTR